MSLTPLPSFTDLVSKAESFATFQELLEPSPTMHVAFIATPGSYSQSHGGSNSNLSRGHGRHQHTMALVVADIPTLLATRSTKLKATMLTATEIAIIRPMLIFI